MVLKDYLAGVRYKTAMAEEELERLPVTSVTNDSRQVRKGSIFVCIRGGRFDGHSKAGEALAAGALRVLRGEEKAKNYTGVPIWNGFPCEPA